MEVNSLDLMSTQEILEYLGRKRYRSMACAGVPNSNNENEVTVSCYVRGIKFIDIVQDDLNQKINKFKDENPDLGDFK
jgi:hypothetical protein